MNPMFGQTSKDGIVYPQIIFESLSYIGADYLPHPRLATCGHIRPTVTVDGRPTARRALVRRRAVHVEGRRLHLRRVNRSQTASINAGDMVYIKRVTGDGPFRVHFTLAYPSAVFTLVGMGFEASILPEHILGRVPHDGCALAPLANIRRHWALPSAPVAAR